MKRLIKFGSIGLLIVGAIASQAEQAFGQVPAIYQQFIPGAVKKLGISGTPNTIRTVSISGVDVDKVSTVRVNACGFAKISNPSALTEGSITINYVSVNVAATKASALITEPTCIDGIPENVPSSGTAFNIGKGAIVIRGLPTSRVLDVTYTSSDPVTRKVNINACGFGSLSGVRTSAYASVDGSTPIRWDTQPYAGLSCNSEGKLFALILNPNVIPQVPIPSIASVSRDSNNSLIFKGVPSSIIPVTIAGASFTKSATSDRCSGLYLPATTTGMITINGVSIDTSSLPTRVGQESCKLFPDGAGYGNTQGYYNTKWSDGRIYIKDYPDLVLGDRSIVSVQGTGTRSISLRTNACGTATISNTPASPLTSTTAFTHDSTSAVIANLPLISALPSCSAKGLTVPFSF